jgi:hypothetical protein
MCEGEQSAEVERLRVLEKDASKYENFGVTKMWKSEVTDGEVVGGGNEEEFGRWLWRE